MPGFGSDSPSAFGPRSSAASEFRDALSVGGPPQARQALADLARLMATKRRGGRAEGRSREPSGRSLREGSGTYQAPVRAGHDVGEAGGEIRGPSTSGPRRASPEATPRQADGNASRLPGAFGRDPFGRKLVSRTRVPASTWVNPLHWTFAVFPGRISRWTTSMSRCTRQRNASTHTAGFVHLAFRRLAGGIAKPLSSVGTSCGRYGRSDVRARP